MDKHLVQWTGVFTQRGESRPPVDGWLDKYEDILIQSQNLPIIDLGCGFGNDTLYLTEKGYRVISCDYCAAALDRLKYFIPSPEARLFNMLDGLPEARLFNMLDGLPFAQSSARVTIADLSLHYFSTPDTFRVLADISRVLEPGGHLLCRVNSVDDVEYGAGRGELIEEHYYNDDGIIKRFFDKAQIDTFFAGWGIEYCKENTLYRYSKPKRVWELALKNIKNGQHS